MLPEATTWATFAEEYARGIDMPWGGWLEQNKAWWEASQRQPKQVLWITFEECIASPEQAV